MINLTDHAIMRYQERVRPNILRRQAEEELRALVASFSADDMVQDVPWAYQTNEKQQRADGFLVLSDGIALIIKRNTAVTCVTRCSTSSEFREQRNKRRRDRRSAIRTLKRADKHGVEGRRKKNMLRAEADW